MTRTGNPAPTSGSTSFHVARWTRGEQEQEERGNDGGPGHRHSNGVARQAGPKRRQTNQQCSQGTHGLSWRREVGIVACVVDEDQDQQKHHARDHRGRETSVRVRGRGRARRPDDGHQGDRNDDLTGKHHEGRHETRLLNRHHGGKQPPEECQYWPG